ncbi:putative transmembrane protein, partial [Toxoplasma gondii RUB]
FFALSGDMAASCSLQNASTTTRFLVGFAVLASILFALSPAVSSLPALSFAAAQVESGVQAAVHVVEGPHAPAVAEEQQITNVRGESPVENSSGGSGSRPAASGAVEPAAVGEPSERGLDGHRSSRGKPESGKQLLERLRRTSTAARGAQTPKAEELKVQEQGLTDDRTIVIRPRAGPREQLKKAFRRNL